MCTKAELGVKNLKQPLEDSPEPVTACGNAWCLLMDIGFQGFLARSWRARPCDLDRQLAGVYGSWIRQQGNDDGSVGAICMMLWGQDLEVNNGVVVDLCCACGNLLCYVRYILLDTKNEVWL